MRSRSTQSVLSSARCARLRPSIQTPSTGTSELDSRNDAIIAQPTASESGTKSDRDTPVMKKEGTNTATTASIARRRGVTTSPLASSTARATGVPRARCVWMFSMATVASSTRMPTASARPPSVMMLMVWPAPHNATTAVSSAKGIVMTTIAELRQSRRNSSTISPVSRAPRPASTTTERSDAATLPDWSSS